jgi:hypothetical protein
MKYATIFLFALLVGYGSNWAPHYVSLFNGHDLKVLGPIAQWREPCRELETSTTRCTDIFRIPRSSLDNYRADGAVGLGLIISATKAYCSQGSGDSMRFGNLSQPGRVSDLLNMYQVVSHSVLACDGDIVVEAWSPKTFRRFGYIGAPAVVGTPDLVERVKKIVEFFTTFFPVILTFLFIGIIVFSRILSAMSRATADSNPLEKYSLYWIGFMVLSSGLAQVLIPVVSANFLFNRVSNFFSIVAHVGSGLLLLQSIHGMPGRISFWPRLLTKKSASIKVEPLLVLVALLCVTPYFATGLGPIVASFGAVFFITGIAMRNPMIGFYGLSLLADSGKIFNIEFLPHSRLTTIFALFVIVDAFLIRLQVGLSLQRVIRWARETIEGSNTQVSTHVILQSFADQFSVKQITLLEPQKQGRCRITTLKKEDGKWETAQIYKEQWPPIFAHALTTREILWHIEEGSLLATNLRKGEESSQHYSGRFFTVVPLLKDSIPVGAIGFTGYRDTFSRNRDKKLEMSSAVGMITPLIANMLSHEGVSENAEWFDKCSTVESHIGRLQRAVRVASEDPLEHVALLLSEHLNATVMISALDEISRELHPRAVVSKSEEVVRLYREAKFYAVTHNEQGPLPLAVSRRRVVTIADVHWLNGVLHPSTARIFALSQTMSCAAVPLFIHESDEDLSRVWGVLWLESKTPGAFTAQHETGLKTIGAAIDSLMGHLKLVQVTARAENALAGFVPQNVLTNLLNDRPVREVDSGYLLMADLRDSTLLSRAVGAERWIEFTTRLSKPVERLAGKYGYNLQSIIWDAFYLTKSGPHSPDHMSEISVLCQKLNGLFKRECENEFGDALPFNDDGRARFCVTHGDITRDVRGGLNNHWCIVGTAMASVSKLEQACKGIKGWLFGVRSVFAEHLGREWQELDVKVQGLGEAVVRYERAPDADKLGQQEYEALFEPVVKKAA